MSEYRIGIIGCGGSGKTAVARIVAKELEIPVLESKSITQPILDRDGYDYSSGIQIEQFLAQCNRQAEMLDKTIAQHQSPSFVTDRTLIDFAAYSINETYKSDMDTLKHVLMQCQAGVCRYTHLFLCPWPEQQIRSNDRRTLNPYYQFIIHSLELGILEDWGLHFYQLESSSPEDRAHEVLADVNFW